MKKSTVENKLNALLGLTEKAEEVKVQQSGRVIGISEEEIQSFRELEGVLYYLQAPALFEPKKCKRESCGEVFLVSRKHVAYCSYHCIRQALKEQGIKWSKGNNIEALVQDPQVYNGNEPLWIRTGILERLQETLQKLSDHSEIPTTTQSGLSHTTEPLQENTGSTLPNHSTPTTSTLAPTQPIANNTPSETPTSEALTRKSAKKPKRTFKVS